MAARLEISYLPNRNVSWTWSSLRIGLTHWCVWEMYHLSAVWAECVDPTAGMEALLLSTRRPNGAKYLPDLCKHDMHPPLGISHVYTNIDGALTAGGRVFVARGVFSVPALPPLSSRALLSPPWGATAGNKTHPKMSSGIPKAHRSQLQRWLMHVGPDLSHGSSCVRSGGTFGSGPCFVLSCLVSLDSKKKNKPRADLKTSVWVGHDRELMMVICSVSLAVFVSVGVAAA